MGRVWGSIPCCTLCAEREIILGKDKRKFTSISSFLAYWSTAWMEKAWKIGNEKVWGTCMWMELWKRKVWRLLYHMWMATESTHNKKKHKQPSSENDSARWDETAYIFGNPSAGTMGTWTELLWQQGWKFWKNGLAQKHGLLLTRADLANVKLPVTD